MNQKEYYEVNLHNDKNLFLDILEECFYETGISKTVIEKNYYVMKCTPLSRHKKSYFINMR